MLQRRGRRFTWSNKKPDENEETEEAQKTEARSFTRAFRTRHFYTLKERLFEGSEEKEQRFFASWKFCVYASVYVYL